MHILESIVTSQNSDGSTHIAPMGVWRQQASLLFAPYRPSSSLDNIMREGAATINCTDDVRIFAACVLRHKSLSSVAFKPNHMILGMYLAEALSHTEIRLDHIQRGELRTTCSCSAVYQANHRPFMGFNRAQAAVIEMAVLVSRLHILGKDEVIAQSQYLKISVDKTAGEREREAWEWLFEKAHVHP